MSKPIRIQLRRTKGWRMPPNTVSVARPGPWGNPFAVWQEHDGQWLVSYRSCHYEQPDRETARKEAVRMFRDWVEGKPGLPYRQDRLHLVDIMKGLRGRNLACWCRLDQPCHADVLLELANRPLTCDTPTPDA